MNRIAIALASALWALTSTTTASAVAQFDVTRVDVNGAPPSDFPRIGDDIVIDIRVSNPTQAYIRAISGAVFGYDPGAVQFVAGSFTETAHFCTDAPCTLGLYNSLYDSQGQPSLIEYNVPGTGAFVPFLSAISITGRNGDGSRDPGFDGVVGGGDAQFRVQFRVIGPGPVHFQIGTSLDPVIGAIVLVGTSPLDPNPVTVQGTNAFVSIVPEPGTALLVGLGLAALSRAGRRH